MQGHALLARLRVGIIYRSSLKLLETLHAARPLANPPLMDSLDRLIDWPISYSSAAPLFCFGLLREFDLPDLIRLSAPVPLCDTGGRGPLRLAHR